jgi:hypothetical protein
LFVEEEDEKEEDELAELFLDNKPCLLSFADNLLKHLTCLEILQCCCTVNRFSAVFFTSHNLQ